MNHTVATASLAPQVNPAWQRFLGFDFGLKRTGVAYGTRLLGSASPQGSIHAEGQARWPLVAQCIAQWQPDALVVGVPCHPDGQAHEMTAHAQKFARQLRGRFGLAVFEVDERYSSAEAEAELRGDSHSGRPRSRGRREQGDLDAGAACIILEQFLRSLA